MYREFNVTMLLSGVAMLIMILLLTRSCWTPWGFLNRNGHVSNGNGAKNHGKKTIRDIPGPFSLPIFGTSWIFSCFGRYRLNKAHEAFEDLNRRYGSLCKVEALWNFPVIYLFDRRDIEAVLGRNTRYPFRPPQELISHYRRTRRDRYTSIGLVNEQGEAWYKLRSTLTPVLTKPSTVFGFFPALNIVTDEFIDLIRERRTGHIVTDFEDLAQRLGFESTCALMLGRHLGFLKPNSSNSLCVKLANELRVYFMALRDSSYGLPFWKLLTTPMYKQFVESEDAIYNIISEIIEISIEEKKNDAQDTSVEAVFLSILRQHNLDIRDKKAAIVDFIAAGIHTLGNTLVFLFNMIGKNPKIQATLYEEVKSLAPPGCDLSVEDVRKAKYLYACIQESFRVMPTAPWIARILDESIDLGEYHLKSGTMVLLHTWIAGKNEENFKNATEYLPQRWLNHPLTPHSPLIVAPFGAGRRTCPGKRFVENALQLILAKIVREFEIVVEEEINLQFEFLVVPQSPVSFGFRDRKLT